MRLNAMYLKKILQNDSEAKTMKFQENTEIITKPTEAKPSTGFYKLQNQPYLQNQNYKTNSLVKKRF